MFERFTTRARRALVLAQVASRDLNHNFIGTEHLLLGLLEEGEGVASRVLIARGVALPELRDKIVDVRARAGSEQPAPAGRFTVKPPFTPRAKKVLELALREALQLGHNYIGTEHILLGLVREERGVGAEALRDMGVHLGDIRQRTLDLLGATPVGRLAVPSSIGPQRSPAVESAMAGAATLAAGKLRITSGDVLLALLDQADSHAALALTGLGLTRDSVAAKLTEIPLAATSDAPPGPQSVEIKLGEVSTEIADPDLASALLDVAPDELQAMLRDALRRRDVGHP